MIHTRLEQVQSIKKAQRWSTTTHRKTCNKLKSKSDASLEIILQRSCKGPFSGFPMDWEAVLYSAVVRT
jgi:hypothetical protein